MIARSRFESVQDRRENFLLLGQLSVLTLIPFYPRVIIIIMDISMAHDP